MQWSDTAIILGTRRHGETSAIVELFTREHGRHLGLVRGGRSRRMQPVLQAGNGVDVVWRARLEDHLGLLAVELTASRAADLFAARHRLYAFQTLAAHLRLYPERDPHPDIHARLERFLDVGDDLRSLAAELARLELHLLADLGHGLDLSVCAATGASDDLVYVSPKTGRAVSRHAGAAYADRLFALPRFLIDSGAAPEIRDIHAAARLAGYFLDRDLYGPRNLRPAAERDRLYAALGSGDEKGPEPKAPARP
ncbi:MAG: DNA repair protein RecO [Flavobacteriaceae bacterium]